MRKLVPIKQVAAEHGVEVQTVREWIEKGVYSDLVNNRRMVDPDDARAYKARIDTRGQRRPGGRRQRDPSAPPREPTDLPPPIDPTKQTRREFWAARLIDLHAKVIEWGATSDPPAAYRDVLVELRHAEKAHAVAVEAEKATIGVDRLPVAEQYARFAERVPALTDAMIVLVLLDARRRFRAELELVCDGERQRLTPEGTWTAP